ncbi:hypothetical protein [Microbacterium sp. che218]|uniref:hypothetical protein n=1 Tax=Microbacterium sp. che218 TaxID=3140649 RepID=UPI00336948E7
MRDHDFGHAYDEETQQTGNDMRIEFTDDLVRAFCERRTDHAYPGDGDLRRALMMRLQGLAAAVTPDDVLALASMGFVPITERGGTVRVTGGYLLEIEFSHDAPPTVFIQGLAPATPTGDRNA